MMSKYLQVAYEIKQFIKTGIYPADYKLSERKLAEEYNTSRATISSALQILKDEGYIISVPQSGSIVAHTNIKKSIWAQFIDKSIGLTSDNRHKATIKYLSKNEKMNSTFGFHKSEFSLLPSLLKTGSDFLLQMLSLRHTPLDKCMSLSSCPSPFPSRF